jgi:hypothetical protein
VNETPWTEVQGFLMAPRLRRITSASLRAPFIPRFKSLGFSGRFDKKDKNKLEKFLADYFKDIHKIHTGRVYVEKEIRWYET